MGSPYWIRTLINKTFSSRYLLARLTRFRAIGRIVDHLLFKNDDIIYLPGDQIVPVDKTVNESESLALPSQVVEYFIRKAGTHWIMDFCICRDSSRCQSYPINYGCIFLGEAARGINPAFGRLVTMEEALAHARRCREAGLIHLIGRNKLDTVWLNIGPPDKLMTICNCCPCCCLWKILPVITPAISSKVSRIPGLHLEVTDRCVGCGACARDICFVKAITMEGGRAVIDQEECRGCGRCESVCPQKAIRVVIDDEKYIIHAIERISEIVDVG
ncbi:MAG: 4Fe-4S binding protein [Thermodesulfobacteriota bacterium]